MFYKNTRNNITYCKDNYILLLDCIQNAIDRVIRGTSCITLVLTRWQHTAAVQLDSNISFIHFFNISK